MTFKFISFLQNLNVLIFGKNLGITDGSGALKYWWIITNHWICDIAECYINGFVTMKRLV